MKLLRAAFLLLGFAACSNVLGIELLPRAAFVDAECGACIDAQCATAADACAADPECANLYACVAGCASSDFDCRDGCEQQHTAATLAGAWKAYASCEENSCGPSCVAPVFADPACAACVEERCPSLSEACAADPGCAPLYQCTARCPVDDWRCRADCDAAHPEGVESAAYEAYDGCRRYLCLDACIGTALPVEWDEAGCAECVAATACEAVERACVGEPGCERLMVCHHDGDDPNSTWISCVHGLYPGVAPFGLSANSLAGCWLSSCAGACGVGESWGCVGSWSIETPAGPDPLFGIVTPAFQGGLLYSGVEVRACSESTPPDSECLEIGIGATTNDHGRATITLPRENGLRFDGHLRLGGTVLTQYWYPDHPIFHDYTDWRIWPLKDLAEYESIGKGWAPGFAVEPGPGYGHVGFQVHDCRYIGAAGAFVDVLGEGKLPETTVAYRYSTLDSGTKADSGYGFMANIQPGHRTLVARLKDGTEVARREVVIGAGSYTWVGLLPTRETP